MRASMHVCIHARMIICICFDAASGGRPNDLHRIRWQRSSLPPQGGWLILPLGTRCSEAGYHSACKRQGARSGQRSSKAQQPWSWLQLLRARPVSLCAFTRAPGGESRCLAPHLCSRAQPAGGVRPTPPAWFRPLPHPGQLHLAALVPATQEGHLPPAATSGLCESLLLHMSRPES